jgi:hypothetical protein
MATLTLSLLTYNSLATLAAAIKITNSKTILLTALDTTTQAILYNQGIQAASASKAKANNKAKAKAKPKASTK